MKVSYLLVFLFFNGGCISFSRHIDLWADTKPGQLLGTCTDTRYQNSIEIKKTGIKVRTYPFVEFGAFGVIVPFQFTKSESLRIDVYNLNSVIDPKNTRLQIDHQELKPSQIIESISGFQAEFKIETLKNIKELTFLIPGEDPILLRAEKGWYFIPIFPPASNGCSGSNSL